MAQEITNFARFYGLLKKLSGADKETLVYQFTNGRTTSLHLMTVKEYTSMCNEMERVVGYDERRELYRKEKENEVLYYTRCNYLGWIQLLGIG